MEKLFKLKEHGTDVRTEIMAGITTFMTMAYILAVNPGILSASGMDSGAIFTATALASAIGCACMAFFANLPFALSAGMGLNAYFAYTVVIGMGYSWEMALTAVFAEGLLFIILSVTNVREAIFNAIPGTLKIGVSVGIGLFICFIGLQNAHICVDGSTLVTMFSFSGSLRNGTFNYEGITVLLALIGILLTGYLVIHQVKGNLLIGILATWALGIICQLVGLYVPNPDAGFYSLIPSGIIAAPASLAPTFMKMDFSVIGTVNFFVVMFSFLFVDIFDTLGTLIGCASKAEMLDEEGHLPGIKGALLADAVANICRVHLRYRRGRPHRTYGADDRRVLCALTVLLADFPDDTFICHRSRSHHRRIHDDAAGRKARLVRYDRGYSGIHRHHGNAFPLLDLRGNFAGNHLLRHSSPALRQDEQDLSAHVCTRCRIHSQIHNAVIAEILSLYSLKSRSRDLAWDSGQR